MADVNLRNRWETNSHLRGLVDNSFDEGHYETAIMTLDQLRASGFNPWPPHLRQLIYISLQTTDESRGKDGLDTPTINSSPSKIVKQQLKISLNPIPPRAVVNARRLLMAYLHTSAPSLLSRALPRRKSPMFATGQNEGDSPFARRAAYILQFRDCWELLCTDLTSRQSAVPPTPGIKPRTRNHSQRIGYDKLDASCAEANVPQVITENAWPLLEWLVSLFEHDESMSTPIARHSPLLADQLLDNDGKAHLEAPVSIIMHCLKQNQLQRQRVAGRLLSLLVNLTIITELDLNALAVVIYTRVPSSIQLSQLLSQIGHSTTIQALKFRIGLCQMLIGGQGPTIVGNVPKPQPRIRPRPAKPIGRQESQPERSSILKPSILSASEVLRLLRLPTPEKPSHDPSFTPLWCPDDQDSDWTEAISENIPQIIRDVFEQQGTEASMYQRLLESQVIGWRRARNAPSYSRKSNTETE
ncbi:hypothetical protein AN958_03135 [Leucoagaricus sp. SymC.cos]|nr:hypothetical protein AN958_03135 [Leucoagaricus sp. SymC.cos]